MVDLAQSTNLLNCHTGIKTKHDNDDDDDFDDITAKLEADFRGRRTLPT